MPSIITMPEYQQASRYLTKSVESMTIAQMTNQIKEEVGTGPKRTKRVGQYTEVIGNPNTIAMDKESIGEMSF